MNKKVCSFDFDDTLFEDPTYKIGNLWALSGSEAEPVKRVHDLLRQKHEEGFEIHVVTFRMPEYIQECWDLIKLYNLPVKSVISTEGRSKTQTLLNLKSTLHVDDSVEVCICAEQAGIKALLVDWKQEDINSTASLLDRI
jgi:phosphoglycolate phosphatase-like HAD superfamily hydrolase